MEEEEDEETEEDRAFIDDEDEDDLEEEDDRSSSRSPVARATAGSFARGSCPENEQFTEKKGTIADWLW